MPYHLPPRDTLFKQSPVRRIGQIPLAAGNQFPPVPRNLLQYVPSFLYLWRLQSKHHAFANSSLRRGQPPGVNVMGFPPCLRIGVTGILEGRGGRQEARALD